MAASEALIVGEDWISEHYFTTDAKSESFQAKAIERRKGEDAAVAGRDAVAKALSASADLRDLEDNGTAFSAARRLGYADIDALYEAVGRGDQALAALVAALTTPAPD